MRQAIKFLQEAVRLDPNYALAYAKLSQAWRQYAVSFATDPKDDTAKAYSEARRAADKAVSLAPDLVEVRMAVGLAGDDPRSRLSQAAEKEFRRVLESAPNDAAAKSALCMSLMAQGRLSRSRGSLPGGAFVRPSPDRFVVQHWPRRGRNGPLQGSRGTVSQRPRDSAARFTFSQLPR